MAVNAWDVAAEAVKALPPMLRDDDLTVKSFYGKHKDDLTSENEARVVLEALAADGRLIKVECRTEKGGAHVIAYRINKPPLAANK